MPGAQEHTIPVKPIDAFIARWQAVRARVLASPEVTSPFPPPSYLEAMPEGGLEKSTLRA